MTYAQAISYLNSFLDFERLPDSFFRTTQADLDRFRELLELLGNPQDNFPIIHIVGTKGKGSTAAILEAVLRRAGMKTGLYTSPHLVTVRERIRVDGRMISRRAFASVLSAIKTTPSAIRLGQRIAYRTVFEHLTAAALAEFARQRVDIAIIEAGLGAKLDATIVLDPVVCVFTKISLDHTAILGESIELIAADKAHAIKPGGVVISSPQQPSVSDELINRAERLDAQLKFTTGEKEFDFVKLSPRWTACRIGRPWLKDRKLILNMAGSFQLENLSTALSTIEVLQESGFKITAEAVASGLRSTRWKGRLQLLDRKKGIIVDGAHNEIAIQTCLKTIRELFPAKKIRVLFAALKNKPYASMLRTILPQCEKLYLAPIRFPRSFDPREVLEIVAQSGLESALFDSIPEAFDRAREETGPDSILLVTGSLYLVGEVIRHTKGLKPPPANGSIDDNY